MFMSVSLFLTEFAFVTVGYFLAEQRWGTDLPWWFTALAALAFSALLPTAGLMLILASDLDNLKGAG
jgi:hypothetical protein